MSVPVPEGLTAEENRTLDHLAAVFFGAKSTVTRKQLKNILLYSDGWLIIRGQRVNIRSKHVGAGVYQIWFEEGQ